MKKTKFAALIIIVSIILLISAFFVVTVVVSADKIVQSDNTVIERGTFFSYQTEKGENIDTVVSVNTRSIGEDIYLINVLFNDRNSSTKYDIKNVKLEFNINDSAEILSAYYSQGNSEYAVPNTNYSEGQKIIKCVSDNGYVYLQLLLSSREIENSTLTVGYDIMGKGFYSFNKFYGLKENVNLSFE